MPPASQEHGIRSLSRATGYRISSLRAQREMFGTSTVRSLRRIRTPSLPLVRLHPIASRTMRVAQRFLRRWHMWETAQAVTFVLIGHPRVVPIKDKWELRIRRTRRGTPISFNGVVPRSGFTVLVTMSPPRTRLLRQRHQPTQILLR